MAEPASDRKVIHLNERRDTRELLETDGLFRVRVVDGLYVVAYRSHQRQRRWGREVFDVLMQILEPMSVAGELDAGGCIGQIVPYCVNRPEKPRKGSASSLRSTLALDFRRVVGLVPPRDLHRVSPEDVYSHCTLAAEIRAVEKDSQGELVPEGARYSRVAKIVRRLDGVPPYAQRRGVRT